MKRYPEAARIAASIQRALAKARREYDQAIEDSEGHSLRTPEGQRTLSRHETWWALKKLNRIARRIIADTKEKEGTP